MLIGIPLGLLLLRSVSEPIVKGVLGVLVAGFAVSALRSRGSYELTDDRLAWLFGMSAGVLGGAYGMNGPPLVVYGALRRWSPEHFRATLQGYFLPASVMGMIGYWAAGLWTPSVSRYYLLSLPTALLAIVHRGKLALIGLLCSGRPIDPRAAGRPGNNGPGLLCSAVSSPCVCFCRCWGSWWHGANVLHWH